MIKYYVIYINELCFTRYKYLWCSTLDLYNIYIIKIINLKNYKTFILVVVK